MYMGVLLIYIFLACVDDGFVESPSFQLDNVCSMLEMALTVSMASGMLKDNQKITMVSTQRHCISA